MLPLTAGQIQTFWTTGFARSSAVMAPDTTPIVARLTSFSAGARSSPDAAILRPGATAAADLEDVLGVPLAR